MSDAERVSSWDDRKADPNEIREYVAINALDALQALESQNQALQEALEAVRIECTCGLRVQHIDEYGNTDYGTSMGCAARDIADRALSPTQETDPACPVCAEADQAEASLSHAADAAYETVMQEIESVRAEHPNHAQETDPE